MNHAISIKQPWAWAIIHAGKNIENRSRKSSYLGTLYIHASQTFDWEGYNWLMERPGLLTAKMPGWVSDYESGGIIGVVEMTGCTRFDETPWFFGPYGYRFINSKPLDFMAMDGQLGIFTF